MTIFTEFIVEGAALVWLEALDYAVLRSPDIAAGALRGQAAPRIARRLAR